MAQQLDNMLLCETIRITQVEEHHPLFLPRFDGKIHQLLRLLPFINWARRALARWGLEDARAHVECVPGHCEVPGNRSAGDFTGCWYANSDSRHYRKKNGSHYNLKTFWMRDIGRTALRGILAATSHHDDFRQYYERSNHEAAETQGTRCVRDKTPLHPWTCTQSSKPMAKRAVSKLILRKNAAKPSTGLRSWTHATPLVG